MKWTCDHCWTMKLAKKTEHLFNYGPDTTLARTALPRLSRRAAKLKAGYMRVYYEGVSLPYVLADSRLLPDDPPGDTLKQILQVRDAGYENGIKRVCFNNLWRHDPEAEHVFLASAQGMTLAETEQAISDAGFGGMNIDGTELDVARRRIDAFIHGVETNW